VWIKTSAKIRMGPHPIHGVVFDDYYM
jgi:hypothetical protein